MSHYRRARTPGGSFFFTVVTERRQKILTNADVRCALREGIQQVRQTLPFNIDGWVLLPDHMHCIWTLPADDADFSTRWRMVKRHVTVACGKHYFRPELMTARRTEKQCGTLWQPRYWEHCLREDEDVRAHLDYLHWNPVKHGLVEHVAEWPWSSFHRYAASGVYSRDWGGSVANDKLISYD